MNGTREYWLYELQRGQGIYQGCTGPGAEGVVRRVVEATKLEPHLGENPGEPFRVFCFEGLPSNQPTPLEMFQADHAAVQDAGFHDTGELLAAYKVLAEQENAARRRIDGFVEKMVKLRNLSNRIRAGSEAAPWVQDEILSILNDF